jgi:hypothetical protein
LLDLTGLRIHEGVELTGGAAVVHREPVHRDPGGNASDLDEAALSRVHLVDVDMIVGAITRRDQVHGRPAEHKTVPEIDVVVLPVLNELDLGSVEGVDAQTAAPSLVSPDDEALGAVGRMDPDRGVVGGTAVGGLPAGENLEHA